MTDKQTPEEKARAEAYAEGVLSEREHTRRALDERDGARTALASLRTVVLRLRCPQRGQIHAGTDDTDGCRICNALDAARSGA